MKNSKPLESEEKFKIISDQSILGILIIHDGSIKYYNEAFIELCGYTKDEVNHWKKYEFINTIYPLDRPLVYNQLEKRMKSGYNEKTNFTFRAITKQGDTKWFSQWSRTILFEGKQSALIMVTDIDERQKKQEALVKNEDLLRSKLDFILSPEVPLENFRITDIFDTNQLQKIQDAFALSHNLASIITDIEGRPITRPSNMSPICNLVRSSLKGSKLCELSDKTIGNKVHETLKPHSSKCLSCGFIETGAPIIVAGKHIANWMIGQGLNKNTDEKRLIETSKQFGIDTTLFLEAYHKTHFVKLDHFNKIIEFLWVMAEEISSLGYNNVKLARDVEERKKVEEELIRSKNKAEESDKLKSAFLANMSHEIRTPMNGILGFANILNEEDLMADQRKEYIEIINQNATQLLKLIDDILDIAKMETNQLTLDEKPSYLDQIMQEIYQLTIKNMNQPGAKEIQVNLRLPEAKLHTLVYIDGHRLQQVLTNLLSNAIKFTQKGFIEFGYDTELPMQLKFYVKDTGIGLPPEKRFLIFDRFRQVDESTSRKYGGTGLGLAISKNLVNLMKGTIWVESEVGQGSTFFFTIPYKPFYDDELTKLSYQNALEPTYNFSDKQILIVEDEQLNFQILYEVLKPTYVKIIHTMNGKEAITLCLKNSSIDLVMMDMNMPVMDGTQTTREIKSVLRHLPVIAMTSQITEEEQDRAIQAGCNDYISIHINSEILLDKISSYFLKIDSAVE